jgi:hypothetical protein
MIDSKRSTLLGTELFRQNLEHEIAQAKEEILIVSAFIKQSGFDWFYSKVKNNKNLKCKFLGRFSAGDIVNQSSDIEVYEKIKEMNWDLKVLEHLHAKVILIDKKTLFVGSPNLTGRGMKLAPISNIEMGIQTFSTQNEYRIVNQLFNEGTLIDDDLYKLLLEWKKTVPKFEDVNFKFSEEIKNKLIKNYKLWVNDFPWSNYESLLENKPTEEILHDNRLFDLSNKFKEEELNLAFINSKIYKWLVNLIKNKDNNFFYFGDLSNQIHNDLYDDPKPYRKTVKQLQVNLYSYIKNLKNLEIECIKDTAHSEKLILK